MPPPGFEPGSWPRKGQMMDQLHQEGVKSSKSTLIFKSLDKEMGPRRFELPTAGVPKPVLLRKYLQEQSYKTSALNRAELQAQQKKKVRMKYIRITF